MRKCKGEGLTRRNWLRKVPYIKAEEAVKPHQPGGPQAANVPMERYPATGTQKDPRLAAPYSIYASYGDSRAQLRSSEPQATSNNNCRQGSQG